jgi:Glyoxalase-like domain
MTGEDIDSQLPTGDEIFLDHVGHFVRDPEAASRALSRVGFAPTPISIQVQPNPAGGSSPTGTGNVTAMLTRGYIEVLFKTADTPLGREFEAAIQRYTGLHLAAFGIADAERAHRQLATDGFRVRPLVSMKRPVDTAAGAQTAAFTVVRVEPDVMPEGRIQMLTHHTEQVVWQKRWLTHPNGAIGLIDLVIAVADVEEAAQRFARFTGRTAMPTSCGTMLCLDRGGILLVAHDALTAILPEVAPATLPFIAGYAVKVKSLAAMETIVDQADLDWRTFERGLVCTFPVELGEGAWFFVEQASVLPWRSWLRPGPFP